MADCALKNLHFFSLDIFFFQISFTIIIETPNLTYDYIRIFCKCRLKNGLQICLKLTTERKKNDDDDNINRNGRKKGASIHIISFNFTLSRSNSAFCLQTKYSLDTIDAHNINI